MSKNTVPHLITITRPAPITDLPEPIRLVIEALPRATYVRVQDDPNGGEPTHRDWMAEIVLCGHRIQLRHYTRPDLPDLSVCFDGQALFSVLTGAAREPAVWTKTILDKVRAVIENSHRLNLFVITDPAQTTV
jgi:hypothetical protein